MASLGSVSISASSSRSSGGLSSNVAIASNNNSGAATGADLTLLPAIFAARMARVAPSATSGFALWSFVQKSTLAFAAIALLPSLSRAGFEPGAENAPEALRALSLMYAGLPCLLKLAALAVLAATPVEED